MAGIAESAVLVSSAAATEAITKLKCVQGPSSDFHNPQHVLSYYPSIGFQATNFGHACRIATSMLRRQAPSKVYLMKDGKYVLVRQHDDEDKDDDDGADTQGSDDRTNKEGNTEKKTKVKTSRDHYVHPNIFLGITANLLGTGCREAVRFLVQEGIVPKSAVKRAGMANEKEEGEEAPLPDDASEDQLMFARLKKEFRETYNTRALADETPSPFRSFLCAVVVSGGGVEHDLRRACAPYTVVHYASEDVLARTTAASAKQQRPDQKKRTTGAAVATDRRNPDVGPATETAVRFGNISYPSQGSEASTLFDMVMRRFVQRLCARQQRLRADAAAKPIPESYLDVCSWSVTPSEVWALLGLWLVDLIAEGLHALQHCSSGSNTGSVGEDHRDENTKTAKTDTAADAVDTTQACAACRAAAVEKARSTVVYWAAVQQVPLYSPSFVDGDIASYLLPSLSDASDAAAQETVQLDLVRDIHSINKLAMQSKKTGMLICGGGVVKHHVCNANLMRNGADYTIILNDGQEFDGSDAGAKPEEALSWGKVRMEGEFIKVYGEVTTYLPLLVTQVFVPEVRHRYQHYPVLASTAHGQEGTEAGGRAVRNRRRRGVQRGEAKATAAADEDLVPEIVSESSSEAETRE